MGQWLGFTKVCWHKQSGEIEEEELTCDSGGPGKLCPPSYLFSCPTNLQLAEVTIFPYPCHLQIHGYSAVFILASSPECFTEL